MLMDLDEHVGEVIAKLKARGFMSPYLRAFVVARINPLRWIQGEPPPLEEVLQDHARARREVQRREGEAGRYRGQRRGGGRLTRTIKLRPFVGEGGPRKGAGSILTRHRLLSLLDFHVWIYDVLVERARSRGFRWRIHGARSNSLRRLVEQFPVLWAQRPSADSPISAHSLVLVRLPEVPRLLREERRQG